MIYPPLKVKAAHLGGDHLKEKMIRASQVRAITQPVRVPLMVTVVKVCAATNRADTRQLT